MSETEHALIFPKNVSGLLMGFNYEFDTLLDEANGYCKYTWDKDMFQLLKECSFRSTGYSSNPMFVYKLVSTYPKENHYLDCFTTYGKSGAYTPDRVFSEAWDEVNAKWDTWRYEAGLS